MKKIFVALFLFVLTCSAFAATKVADDPTRINVGARPLGMGKAFVGAANDINSIFLNPAGLSHIASWQATSLSGQFLNEVNYMIVGGAWPTHSGVMSVAYTGSNLGFTSPGVTLEGGRVVVSSQEGTNFSDYDSVILVAYATALKNLLNWKVFEHFDFGTTLKLFSRELGASGTGYAASGYEMDLGVQYKKPKSPIKFGLTAQNVLPYSMGGKIVWTTGLIETHPVVIKPGLSLKLLGKDGLREHAHSLDLNVDADYHYGQSHLPSLLHLGLEWSPVSYLAIRTGIDQEIMGSSVVNNLTAGVGLTFSRFRFDYAYHEFAAAPGISNHFLSISYGIGPEPVSQFEQKVLATTTSTMLKTSTTTQVPPTTFAPTLIEQPKKIVVQAKEVKAKPRPIKKPVKPIAKAKIWLTEKLQLPVKAIQEDPLISAEIKVLPPKMVVPAAEKAEDSRANSAAILAGAISLISIGLFSLWKFIKR